MSASASAYVRRHATTCRATQRATVSPSTPASFKRCSVSVCVMSGNATGSPIRRPRHAGQQWRQLRHRALRRMHRLSQHAPRDELRRRGHLGDGEHGCDARVRPRQLGHPLVARPTSERRRRTPNGSDPAPRRRAAAQPVPATPTPRTSWRRTSPRWRPRRATSRPTPRTSRNTQSDRTRCRDPAARPHPVPAARRWRATSATAHPRATDTSRYAPRPVVARPASAAVMASAACRPPAAASATVAPGNGGAPPTPGVLMARKPPTAR